MNLFLVLCSPAGAADRARAERAVAGLRSRLPFFLDEPVQSWSSPAGTVAAAWLAHAPARTGGVRHVHTTDGSLALFAGRPVRWEGDAAPAGAASLDPAAYARPAAEWAEALEGRAAALRYDESDRVLELCTDPLGAYPLYDTALGADAAFSNSAELLRSLSGSRALDLEALAGLLGGGWSLTGNPLWSAVRRIPRGTLVRVAPDGRREERALWPDAQIARLPGAGADAPEAARTLVALTRALADWPGRPSVVPVTAGRDSRLVFAAALRGEISFTAATGGAADDPDVLVGRRLCELAGVAHEMLAPDPHGDAFSDPAGAASLLMLTAGGTATLADAAGFPMGPRDGPLPLWHSGQGGEVARRYYGVSGARDAAGVGEFLFRAFTGRRPGRAAPLSQEGTALVAAHLRRFAAAQLEAGADAADVPDLFYLHRRMGTWAGPTHGCVEFVRDTTSPLWSIRLLGHLLGLPAGARAREHFHLLVLRELAPELVSVPFEGGQTWAGHRSGARQRLERVQRTGVKAVSELRRRVVPRGSRDASRADPEPFAGVLDLVRGAVAARPDHPAWPVLDRDRVGSLLERHPDSLDTMSRYYVWRLATVFLADLD